MSSLSSLTFLAVLLGGVAIWHLYSEHEEALVALQSARSLHAQEQFRFQEQQAILKNFESNQALQQRAYEASQTVQQAQEQLADLTRQLESHRFQFGLKLIERRKDAIGKEIAQVRLPDGKYLRQVKIMKVDSSGVSLHTDAGVRKLGVDEVPEHWRDFFRFDHIEPSASMGGAVTYEGVSSAGAGPSATSTMGSMRRGSASSVFGSVWQFSPSAEGSSASLSRDEYAKKTARLNLALADYDRRIKGLNEMKSAPLSGLDGRLSPTSRAYQYRKKERDARLDREIAALNAQRKALFNQLAAHQKERPQR